MDRQEFPIEDGNRLEPTTRKKRWPSTAALMLGLLCPACSFSQEKAIPRPMTPMPAMSEAGQDADGNLIDNLFNGKKNRNEKLDDVVRGNDGKYRSRSASAKQLELVKIEFDGAEQYYQKKDFKAAGKRFHALAKKYEDTPLEEEALFKEGECYFTLKQYPAAEEAYAKLLKKYCSTRFSTQAVERMYTIANYWLDDARQEANKGKPKTSKFTRMINFFDKTRPTFDTEGRALAAIDSISRHEPGGPVADDAIMLAAAYQYSKETPDKFFQAGNEYEQVVLTQPKSEHVDKAYFLGVQAYLKSYRGHDYDPTELNKAEQMAKAALARKTLTPEQRSKLEEDLKFIELQHAEREFARGQDYINMRRRNAARYHFGLVVSKYPQTEWARKAKAELAKLGPQEPDYEPGLLGELSKKTLAEHFRQKRQETQAAEKTSTMQKVEQPQDINLPKPPASENRTGEMQDSDPRSNARRPNQGS